MMELGISPLGDLSPEEELLETLLRLQGSGYASGDDSARVRELLAIAEAFGASVATLEAVANGMFPQLAVEFLAEHEAGARLPNDAARTIEERQARHVALRAVRALPTAPSIEAALARLGVTATMHRLTRAQVEAEGSEPEAIFQSALELDSWTPKVRATAEYMLRRMLPAWQMGQLCHHRPDEMLVSAVGATWNGADEASTLGRGAIAGSGGSTTYYTDVARLKHYAGLSRLNARDLNALQRHTLIAGCSSADNDLLVLPAGGRFYFFAFSVAAGATVEVLTGADYRGRLARVTAFVSSSDVRPGQASDTVLNAVDNTASAFFLPWYTGTGGATYDLSLDGAVGYFRASSTDIDFVSTAAGTRYVVGCIELSSDVRSTSGGHRAGEIATVADEQTLQAAGIATAWWQQWRDGALHKAANGAGVDAWTAFPSGAEGGGASRLVCVGYAEPPGSAATTFVVDASIDWRDRLLFVELPAIAHVSANPEFPGSTGDEDLAATRLPAFGFTGSGITTGLAAAQSYHVAPGWSWRLGARSSDGALVMELPTGSPYGTGVFFVHASERLGERSAAAARSFPAAPSNGQPVRPYELNRVQDCSMMVQGLPATRRQHPYTSQVAVSGLPFGLLTRGSPRVSQSYSAAVRDGVRGTSANQVMQHAAGGLRRVFACDLATATALVLDTSVDWRDRMLSWLVGYSASDIRPGGAADDDIANGTATLTYACGYMGPGFGGAGQPSNLDDYTAAPLGVGEFDVALYARASDGALMLRHTFGATRYFVGWIEATFQLGARSQG